MKIKKLFLKIINIRKNKQLKDEKVNDKIKDNERMRQILEKEGIDFIYF